MIAELRLRLVNVMACMVVSRTETIMKTTFHTSVKFLCKAKINM